MMLGDYLSNEVGSTAVFTPGMHQEAACSQNKLAVLTKHNASSTVADTRLVVL